MNVYFMRHGETDWNIVRRLQGSTDIPLNENGIALAKRVSQAVHESGIRFDRVYTSPLVRAVTTAELMNAYSQAPLVRDERITEFCFGSAEGVTFDTVLSDERFAWLKTWFVQPEAYTPAEGAESLTDFCARITDFLDALRAEEAQAAADGAGERNVLVVCHGGVVRALVQCMTGERAPIVTNCSMNLAVLKNGVFSIKYLAKVFARLPESTAAQEAQS